MPTQSLFATHLYTARLGGAQASELNARLRQESLQTRLDDAAGRRWSKRNYPGGYTSYHSLCRMHTLSPTFERLERRLRRHVGIFAEGLELDLSGRELSMTDCWINIMSKLVVHSLHLHPLATISGTYFVHTPRGCPGLKFEDPRLDRFMAAPPRRSDCRPENRTWHTVPAASGHLVLFESWLRHEVAPNPLSAERISVSFNYSWF
jgi:uncharacterized protein (TIGR02466 family)